MPQPQDELRRSRRPCEVRAERRTEPAILNTEPSRIWLAFRTDPTALPQACTPIGAAAMPEIMPDRQHTMHAVAIGAFASAPDVGAGALGRRPASSADRFRVSSQDRGLPPQFQKTRK
jgi:hypothetical protein